MADNNPELQAKLQELEHELEVCTSTKDMHVSFVLCRIVCMGSRRKGSALVSRLRGVAIQLSSPSAKE
jgi:hypothetical protein